MEITFQSTKTFRYEVINDHPEVEAVLYVLHGYGQLVKYFIQKFEKIPSHIMIVAPEGMHRFYLKGNAGRVGASWMTKELREVDIADNIGWLNDLDAHISASHSLKRRYLLGFSQGGSTAMRWKMHGKVNFNALIIWASDFPPDERENTNKLANADLHFALGTEDEFCPPNQQDALINSYKHAGFKISTYLGRHDIQTETLIEIIEQIDASA